MRKETDRQLGNYWWFVENLMMGVEQMFEVSNLFWSPDRYDSFLIGLIVLKFMHKNERPPEDIKPKANSRLMCTNFSPSVSGLDIARRIV